MYSNVLEKVARAPDAKTPSNGIRCGWDTLDNNALLRITVEKLKSIRRQWLHRRGRARIKIQNGLSKARAIISSVQFLKGCDPLDLSKSSFGTNHGTSFFWLATFARHC